MQGGNAVAALALLAWPAVSVVLFRYLSMSRALIGSIVISYLFLPPSLAGFDFPVLPPLTKDTIPNIVLVIICLTMAKKPVQWLPENPIAAGLLVIFVLSPIVTIMTNSEPVFYGQIGLPGLRFREAVALCMQQFLFLTPLMLARHFLANEEGQKEILVALVLAGLVYSLPTLMEVRLSPQLNLWVYGFFQHNFDQAIRFGGYRPLVFLYHGIWLAFFGMTATVCAFALMRANFNNQRLVLLFVGFYLAAVLVLCKSAGALVWAMALVPLVVFASKRLMLTLSAVVVAVVLTYPVLKQFGVLPIEELLARIEGMSLERANSLRFRFTNEDILLERAFLKPLFGWGSWGRNHILDPVSGNFLTVTDGRWIIVIGVYGWLGFLAEFGLLAFPIFLIFWKTLRGDLSGLSPYIGAMALLLAVNIADLIPNATITPITWLFAGAILGYAERYVPVRYATPYPIQTVL